MWSGPISSECRGSIKWVHLVVCSDLEGFRQLNYSSIFMGFIIIMGKFILIRGIGDQKLLVFVLRIRVITPNDCTFMVAT